VRGKRRNRREQEKKEGEERSQRGSSSCGKNTWVTVRVAGIRELRSGKGRDNSSHSPVKQPKETQRRPTFKGPKKTGFVSYEEHQTPMGARESG